MPQLPLSVPAATVESWSCWLRHPSSPHCWRPIERWTRQKRGLLRFFCCTHLLSASILFLNHSMASSGIVGRLSHLQYLQVAILVPTIAWILWRRFPATKGWATLTVFVILLAQSQSLRPKGLRADYLENRSRIAAALAGQRALDQRGKVFVARHGDEFMVTAITGAPATSRPSGTPKDAVWLLRNLPCNSLQEPEILSPEVEGGCAALVAASGLADVERRLTPEEASAVSEVNPPLRIAGWQMG